MGITKSNTKNQKIPTMMKNNFIKSKLKELDSMEVCRNEFWLKVFLEGEDKDAKIEILNDALQVLKPYLKDWLEQACRPVDAG